VLKDHADRKDDEWGKSLVHFRDTYIKELK